ncbi:MAG: J domain-containing protein [Myxococcota bacterium]|nr:J domain-containing protein [Myxococcota bacterium]
MGIWRRLSRLVRAEVSHHSGRKAPAPEPAASSGPSPDPSPERPQTPPQVARAYGVLGVKVGGDRETCREAWIELMKRHHPDHNQDLDAESRHRAQERTLEIQSAWETLDEWLPAQ